MQRFLAAALTVLTAGGIANAVITPSQTARLSAAAQALRSVQGSIPDELWNRAQCVAAIPDLKEAALIVGGDYGRGVMSCRAGEQWSAPAFLRLGKGNWGFQAGAEEMDVVLLVMNEEGVQKLLQNSTTLGEDASVAPGPIGRQGEGGGDESLTADIVAYSQAKGLVAGVDLSGSVLRPDVDSNTAVYGSRATPRTILASREISAPTEAHGFLGALSARTAASAAPQQPGPPAPPQATRAVPPASRTDDDLQARIVEIQQILDRILADTTPGPVGTSGSTPPAPSTISVDRGRLLQMREQLDALLAALRR